MQKHIAVVNGLWIGHHSIYVKTFVKVLLEAGYRVSIFCPAPDEVSSWLNEFLPVAKGSFDAHYFADREPWLWRFMPRRIQYALGSWPRWFYASRGLRKFIPPTGKPDLVFFAWIDCYLVGYLPAKFIDWLFPYTWSGLYFHPRHLRADKKPRRGRLIVPPEEFIAQSKRAASIAVLDEGIIEALRAGLDGKHVFALPDFSDETTPYGRSELADQISKNANGRKIIGLLGGLSRRKGLLTLISIAKQSSGTDWYFVFAGRLVEETFSSDELEEIKLFFGSHREDCFFHIEKISSDAEFNALVNACDVIFAMYENFPHSSNLITKSAIYGKNVLVSTGGYMEEVVTRYRLGEAVPAGSVQEAWKALYRLTSGDHMPENLAGMNEYARKQSQEKLRQIFLDLIESSTNSLVGMGRNKACAG